MVNSFDNVALALVREESGDGDPYGLYLNAQFDVAEVLYTMGVFPPKTWEFQPSPFLGFASVDFDGEDTEPDTFDNMDQSLLWDARDGLTRPEYIDQLVHAGNVLARLVNLCKIEGLDY